VPRFRPLRRLANAAALLLLLNVPWTAVVVTADVLALDGAPSAALDTALLWFGLVFFWPFVGIFLWWYARAYRDLDALAVGPRPRSTTWAVVSWLVPIAGFVVPYRTMAELWRAGEPAASGNPAWRSLPTPGLLRWWWGSYVLSWTFGIAALLESIWAEYAEVSSSTSYALDIASQLVALPGVLLAALLVRRVTARLEARAAARA
jgi:hypothetical protein